MQQRDHANFQDLLIRRYLLSLTGNPIADFRWVEHSDWKLLMLETREGKNIALLVRPDEAIKPRILCSRITSAMRRLKSHDANREVPA